MWQFSFKRNGNDEDNGAGWNIFVFIFTPRIFSSRNIIPFIRHHMLIAEIFLESFSVLTGFSWQPPELN